MKPIIRVENLNKQYRIGVRGPHYATFREALVKTLQAPFKRLTQNGHVAFETVLALKDVNFEVNAGELVGIIGRNGAGKSTLLKVLSRITEPTSGQVELYGRVGSLLEIGTGFHGELTGRENMYLNGAILGMKHREIDRKFDEIVAFAEIEKFLDTPVKYYSSGMYMRLAFAVAAHLQPEILLVDEVLAVGDVAFQKKCLGKMGEVAKEGRTVLFVSHNMGAVQQLTHTSLLLHNGELIANGPTADVIDKYLKTTMEHSAGIYNVENAHRRHPDLHRQVEFVSLELEDCPTKLVPADADINIKIVVRGNEAVEKFRFSMTIFKLDGTPVGSFFGPENNSIGKGEQATFRLELRDLRLAQGMYYCGLATGRGNPQEGYSDFDIVEDVLHFEVMAPEGVDGTRAVWSAGWGPVRFKEMLTSRIC
jgi:lipopolysaccharide transport system ATP-binding protein